MTSQVPDTTSTSSKNEDGKARRAHIGSYVLESLTTGMYGEPRHTMREYVQNAFDAIEMARANGTLKRDEGTVVITIDSAGNNISVRDDGIGIRSDLAWKTLSAVGASAKDRTERAGFRGIGRLAGLAYCEKLHFVTKHRTDVTEAKITFDCVRLRKGMDPIENGGEDIQTLLTEAISDTYRDVSEDERSWHYTNVILENVSLAPEEVKSVDKLSFYLSQTAPVDFHPDLWKHSEKIEKFAAEQGEPIKTVRLLMRHVAATSPIAIPDEPISVTEFEVFKPYRDSHAPKGKAPVPVTDVRLHADPTGNKKWWGWVGEMPVFGTLADQDAAGLRVRVKNIQIDGTDIMERMFSDIRVSYARFNKYYIGEFHIVSDGVVPNARRDGFEENQAWHDIQDEVTPLLSGLTKSTYRTSKGRNDKYKEFKRSVDAVSEAVERRLTLPAGIDGGNDQALLLHLNDVAQKLGSEVSRDLATEDETRTLRLLQATINESRRRFQRTLSASATSESMSERSDRQDRVLKIVWSVMQELIDPMLYRETRREIERRLADAGL